MISNCSKKISFYFDCLRRNLFWPSMQDLYFDVDGLNYAMLKQLQDFTPRK